jgi:hypothetical protein
MAEEEGHRSPPEEKGGRRLPEENVGRRHVPLAILQEVWAYGGTGGDLRQYQVDRTHAGVQWVNADLIELEWRKRGAPYTEALAKWRRAKSEIPPPTFARPRKCRLYNYDQVVRLNGRKSGLERKTRKIRSDSEESEESQGDEGNAASSFEGRFFKEVQTLPTKRKRRRMSYAGRSM